MHNGRKKFIFVKNAQKYGCCAVFIQ
jgi:hypothetical protein